MQVYQFESGDYVIVSSLSTRNDTQIVRIDPTTGVLQYQGRYGLDLFSSERDAIQYITTTGTVIKSFPARAIIGYAALGGVGLLLIATRLKQSVPALPCGDTVFTVTESQCIRIPLRNPQYQSKSESKNANDLAEIQLDNLHYFCETRDITRPFPSKYSIGTPDREFVWNEWLSFPFKTVGLPNHCVTLLQVCLQFTSTWLQFIFKNKCLLRGNPSLRFICALRTRSFMFVGVKRLNTIIV